MLTQKVFIYSPSSLGNTRYSFELYFVDTSVAKYVNIGDAVSDNAGNEYVIEDAGDLPVSDGRRVTCRAITHDVLPAEDSGYDSSIYTPGQIDYTPQVKTSGEITSVANYEPWNYQYTLEANWFEPLQSSNARIGDSIVDSSGKEFIITYLSTDKFSSAFRVQEREKTMVPPIAGAATLYRSTSTYKFFQGNNLSADANLRILQRDNAIVDQMSNGTWNDFFHSVTAEEIAAKRIVLSNTPKDTTKVNVEFEGGPDIEGHGIDYMLESNIYRWDGMGLDGVLIEGDLLQFQYFS